MTDKDKNTQDLFEMLKLDEDLIDTNPYNYNYETQDIDLNKVRELLTKGVNINAKDGEGNTLLITVLNNYLIDPEVLGEILNLLLKAGADVNIPKDVIHHPTFDENVDLPIEITISNVNFLTTNLLVDNNADVNKSLTNNMTPFQRAVIMPEINEHLGLIEKMIKKGADINHVDINDEDTLYHLFANNDLPMESKKDILNLLLSNGAKINPESFNKLQQYLNEHNLTEQFERMLKELKPANWRRIAPFILFTEGTNIPDKHYLTKPFVNREIAQFMEPTITGGKRKTLRKNNNKSNKKNNKTKRRKNRYRKTLRKHK
jgi:ankyrin repeat protein